MDIVRKFPDYFLEARIRPLPKLEEMFLAAFLELAGEPLLPDLSRYMISYSASCAITMAVSHCARGGKRVALLEPTFDNIPSILRREKVEVVSLSEQDCAAERLATVLAFLEPDVVWLVTPNNPTGWTLTEAEFRALVRICAERRVLLVLDMSFRFFDLSMRAWSVYEILENAGLSYIVFEDTGKTWATDDIKVGLTVCSPDMYTEMYRMHDDLLQSVSPFHLAVLTDFIADTTSSGLEASVMPFVRQNRSILRSGLRDDIFGFETDVHAPISVDWVRISGGFDCEELVDAAIQGGVHVLPGTNFYWSTPQEGRSFIRIPLTRDPQVMSAGIGILNEAAARIAVTRESAFLASGKQVNAQDRV